MRLPAVRWAEYRNLADCGTAACVLWLGLLTAADSRCLAGERADREAEEAKKEQEAEDALPEMQRPVVNVTGVFRVLASKDADIPADVVGTLVVETMTGKSPISLSRGAFVLVKAGNAEVAKSLPKSNNKKVTLVGKLRNAGKYVIAMGVLEPSGPSRDHSQPGGL
jgi:ATP-dependent 26S proteasome regulatory subunit